MTEKNLPAASSPQPQPTPHQPKASSWGCIAIAIILGGAIVASALIITGAFRDLGVGISKVAESNPLSAIATALPPPTPTIVVRPPAIRQVRAVADLTTVSALLSTVVEAEQPRLDGLVSEKLLLIACGKVTAGVDLAGIKEADITASEDGTVTVRLPKAQIKDTFLIDDATQPCTTKVYDRTNLLVIPETKELEGQAREKAVEAIRDTAIQSGVLTDANKNARAVIEKVLLLAGYQKVIFVEN